MSFSSNFLPGYENRIYSTKVVSSVFLYKRKESTVVSLGVSVDGNKCLVYLAITRVSGEKDQTPRTVGTDFQEFRFETLEPYEKRRRGCEVLLV